MMIGRFVDTQNYKFGRGKKYIFLIVTINPKYNQKSV